MATGVTDAKSKELTTPEDASSYKDSEVAEGTGASPKARAAPAAAGKVDTPATPGVALDNLYFFEDEIFRIDKKGRVRFGLVIETAETYSGDEDDDFDDVLNKGEVRVAWYPEGKEDVQSERTIGLADRTLMPGDVVRRLVPGQKTQRGYCREINMHADVKVLGTKYVIKGVLGDRLRLIANWPRDSAVCLDSWVGSTKDIEEKAVLRSACGARIEVSSADFYAFKDINTRHMRGIFNPHAFYPGNVVMGHLQSLENVKLLTPKNPLPTNRKGKPLPGKFTIESIYTDSVWVHWQYKALSDDANIQCGALQQPNPCVTGEDLKRLKRLNLFESCMLQINDRNYLKYAQQDNVVKKSYWDKEQAAKFKLVLSEQQKIENILSFVHANSGVGSGSNTGSHHFDKFKKKFSILDTGKTKKYFLKEKFSNTASKEKCEKNQDNNSSNASIKTATDSSWISEDDADSRTDEKGEEYCSGMRDAQDSSKESISPTTPLSTCSSPSPRTSPKHITRRQFRKKISKPMKTSFNPVTLSPEFLPKDGHQLVTEALLVYSTATVVWQDGIVEKNIPSTQLYPIHHLDNHEFFPGDFVISGKEEADVSFRDYGVIQTVDHLGRTARVKWFTTYTSLDEPKPTCKGETEVSVYDLKDHPDFQYHPGTIVIRVANFVGEDASCTAGQIIDNFTDGRVKVWWVDGHISMCWPQDLFEVGQYDHADWGHESEDSWETESENSEFGGGSSPKLSISESHILSNIERARVAIARLEEIFNISPNLQSPEVMRKLLTVYKGCRYLDRLLSTSFFHEDNFNGLIERVRKGGVQTVSERALVRKNRLFSDTQLASPNLKQQQLHQGHQHQHQQCHYHAIVSLNGSQRLQNSISNASGKEYAPKVLLNISSTPFKFTPSACSMGTLNGGLNTVSSTPSASKRKCSSATLVKGEIQQSDKPTEAPMHASPPAMEVGGGHDVAMAQTMDHTPNKQNFNAERNELLNSAMLNIEKAFEKTSQLKYAFTAGLSQDDSGNFSRNENCDGSSTSYASSSDLTNVDANNSSLVKTNDEQNSVSCSSIELTEDATPELVCVRLCSLLKDQLVKCINEIREKYYKEDNLNMSDVFDGDDAEDETSETLVEVTNSLDSIACKEAKEASALSKSSSAESPEAVEATAIITVPPSPPVSLVVPTECFQILSSAPTTHKFHLTIFHPNNPQHYYKAVQREHRMLKNSLPPGVWVRVFEDRLDLLSVMIQGPSKTPYENGMFFFDIQLGREYPKSPPLCHYISYCSDRLNPNLYEDGKVCVSLLGTWSGRDSEVWGPNSTLLQVIVSIQGLILVPEPYFNEAGYEKQKGTQQGKENSRMYNEMVIIKMVQATTKLLQQSPEMFRAEILQHYQLHGQAMYERIRGWMELSKLTPNAIEYAQATALTADVTEEQQDVAAGCSYTAATSAYKLPAFSLVPASRGFCLTLAGLLQTFKLKLDKLTAVAATDSTAAAVCSAMAASLGIAATQAE